MSYHVSDIGSITATQGSGNKIVTWERADGTAIETPARADGMDLFAQHAEPFDQINPGPGSDRVGPLPKMQDIITGVLWDD